MPDFLEELRARDQLQQATAGSMLARHLSAAPRAAYCGLDPSVDSLTIGNFVPIKALMHWQRCGHRPIVLMGGGTGLIGDPSGKDAERPLLSREQVEANVLGQRRIYERLLDFDPSNPVAAVLVNNADWLGELRYLDVLRDVGKHFSVNAMIQKDSVRARLEEREQGISYTEFSYMILQAYDFLHLRRTMDCTVQLAGSDQYGNIVAGIDLIRREFGGGYLPPAFGVTVPLVTRADGGKIGKTEKGSVWLTADRTSPYQFYQYWINTDDRDLETFLKWFTLLPLEEIAGIVRAHVAAPQARRGQRELARFMTELVHGRDEWRRAEAASDALFTGHVRDLDEAMLAEVCADVPASTHDREQLRGSGLALLELLPRTTLAGSKRQAREFLGNGAVFLNGEPVTAAHAVTSEDLLHGRVILLRRGKKSWHATLWQ